MALRLARAVPSRLLKDTEIDKRFVPRKVEEQSHER